MHFTCRSFSGNSESKSWSRYWENDPDDPFLKSSKGHLFALVNISSNDDKELNSIGHDINFEFNQNYFNPENKLDTLSNLQQSINSVIKNPLYSSYKIDFTAVIILDQKIFIAATGDTKIILKRQNQISILLNNPLNQIDTLTGTIQNHDRLFLLTNSFFEKISWQKIKLFLSDEKIETIEENFLSSIFSLVDQRDLAAALIEIESDETEFTPPSPINTFQKPQSVFISHHLTKEVGKRRKLIAVIGIILLIILSVSFYFGRRKTISQKTEAQYQQLKTEIDTQIENINKTKSLNLDSAREIANNAQSIITQMSTLKIHTDEVQNYSSQLTSILSQTGSSESYNPDTFYDTSNIASNLQFEKIIFNDNKIYLLDPTNGRIDYINVETKSTKSVLKSEKIKNALNFALDKTNFYLMNKEGINLIGKDDISNKITFENISPTDFKFWNGSAYVLDSTNQTIWKYTPNSTGFSDAQNWLKNDAKLNLGAISISINGKIWILYQNGTVVPYLSGVKDSFTPNQTSQFTQTDSIDVTQEKELLSFVDNKNTIYLYQKSGELLKKFNLGDLNIKDITFNEAANLIYVLCSDQKIYSIKF